MNTSQLRLMKNYQEVLPHELFTTTLKRFNIVSLHQVTPVMVKPLMKALKDAKAGVADNLVPTKTNIVPTKTNIVPTKVVPTSTDVPTKLDRSMKFRYNEVIDNKLVLLSKELNLTKSEVIRLAIMKLKKEN